MVLRMRDSRKYPQLNFWGPSGPPDMTSSPRNVDVGWLIEHSTCPK
jgi:hypothetical protein